MSTRDEATLSEAPLDVCEACGGDRRECGGPYEGERDGEPECSLSSPEEHSSPSADPNQG